MNSLLLFLLDASAADTTAANQNGSTSWMPSWLPTVGMIVLLIVIFYFFMIRPQQKRQKKLQEAREALKKGDKVVTAGGIHGRIVEVRDQTFVIAVEDNTHLEVDKTAIAFNENELK